MIRFFDQSTCKTYQGPVQSFMENKISIDSLVCEIFWHRHHTTLIQGHMYTFIRIKVTIITKNYEGYDNYYFTLIW